MTERDIENILRIALLAALADGLKDDAERAAVRQVAAALGAQGRIDFPVLLKEVLLEPPDLDTLAARLESRETRQLAYELAVGVCDADGEQNAAERRFLAELAAALELPQATARDVSERANAIANAADAPLATASPSGPAAASAAVDAMILKASITNAALELLPESLASLAIIPLQMRLVYRIGLTHGYELDRGHVRDFLATAGVGLASQYIEQAGRKLLGGLLGSVGGGLGRYVGRQAASSGLAFATTYALGRLAQRYYAGGRTLDAATLRDTFASLLEEAKRLAPTYREQIEARAQTIDRREIAQLVRTF